MDKDALVTSAFPAVIKKLRRIICLRRIAPPELVAVDEDDAAQNTLVIYALAAMAREKIRLKTSHLLVRKPQQITDQSGSYPLL